MSTRIKIITTIYFLILVGIVVLANNKGTTHLLQFSGGIPYFDKIAHFFLMGLFSFLLNIALGLKSVRLIWFNVLLGSLVVFVVVTIEEFSQIYVSGRAFDLGDLAADYVGISIFSVLAGRYFRRFIDK